MTRRRWIGLDGEGIGRSPHRYTLLAYSDAQGRGDYVEDVRGLSTLACLDLILSTPTDARISGYYLGYDWTMILRDLPDRSIYRLLRPELRAAPRGEFSRVYYRGYSLHFLAGMMRVRRKSRTVTVWDLGRFFQAPFTDAIETWGIDAPHDEIAEMKAARGTFANETADRIREYCFAECKALASLATELEQAHVDVGLKPGAWFGPGSTASVALDRMGIRDRRGKIPRGVQDAAERAFFGGRFEQRLCGTVDAVAGYDIVSAYPYQAYQSPCLQHGTWEWVPGRVPSDARAACVRYRVRDVGSDVPWGPLPCRMPDGTIVFGRSGWRGWAWHSEWAAAKRLVSRGLYYLGAWVLRGECDCRPFARILDWFAERIRMGKSGRGRVLKLALNSIYGKLAQTVGRPKYASRVWAGMITAGTRAQLLDMVVRHRDPYNVIALATDGLYSTECVTDLETPMAGSSLGSWEAEYHGRMTFVRPGIYFAHDDATVRARGLGRKTLDKQRALVIEAIKSGVERADLGTCDMFGGARSSVYRTQNGTLKRSRLYGEWYQAPARVSLSPAPKRNADWTLRALPPVTESAPYRAGVLSDDARMLRALDDLTWGMR